VAESFFIAKNHSGARFRSKRELAVTVGWGNPLFQWKVTEYSEGSIFKAAGRLIGPKGEMQKAKEIPNDTNIAL
jgi:hypothetical protein